MSLEHKKEVIKVKLICYRKNIYSVFFVAMALCALLLTVFAITTIPVEAAKETRIYKIHSDPLSDAYTESSMKAESGSFKAPSAPVSRYSSIAFVRWKCLTNNETYNANETLGEYAFEIDSSGEKVTTLAAVWKKDGVEFDSASLENGFANVLYSWANTVYGNGMIDGTKDLLTFGFSAEHIDEQAGGEVDENSLTAQIWKAVKQGYNICIGVGYALVVLYLLIDIMDKITQDSFNVEVFLKSFIKAIVAVLIIANGMVILENVIEFGNRLLLSISDGAGSSEDTVNTVLEWRTKLLDAGFLTLLGYMVCLVFDYILLFISQMVIWVCCISRSLELGVRAIFTPIALADVFGEGLKGPGIRYIKKFLAVCLQASIMLTLLMLYQAIINADISGLGTTAIKIVAAFTLVGMMFKSITFANDVVGV